MDIVGQLVTIAAVLLGGLTTHFTNHRMERQRTAFATLTRWDERKLDAYAEYIDCVRTCIYTSVLLYETKEGMRSIDRSEPDLTLDLADAEGSRGRAFERVMLLAEDGVIEAAHELNSAAHAIDWRAHGRTSGTLEEWRALHRTVFEAINRFHEAARVDLGVNGRFQGEDHGARGLILPETRRELDS
ncbi:hypothetical protein [Streptomyces albipurpureus]|uniref:Secreted protein n=1 Tax=Streptomyces albipurpureus TaxID=2897419 RepID=A0ABT0V0J4_9ACTN|nr:hypothetical protein [Streptomyces sp. CWNU-1]MCM2393083.1 hypothetical protein [Streptomyces sp. CWNU-1]